MLDKLKNLVGWNHTPYYKEKKGVIVFCCPYHSEFILKGFGKEEWKRSMENKQ